MRMGIKEFLHDLTTDDEVTIHCQEVALQEANDLRRVGLKNMHELAQSYKSLRVSWDSQLQTGR